MTALALLTDMQMHHKTAQVMQDVQLHGWKQPKKPGTWPGPRPPALQRQDRLKCSAAL